MKPVGLMLSIALAAECLGFGVAHGQCPFSIGSSTFGSQLASGSIAVADFDGDGRPDFAVPKSANNTVAIFHSNADGSFASPIEYPVGTSGLIAAGDFNGDGRADFVLITGSPDNAMVFLGNANGTFQPPVSYPLGGDTPSYVTVVDVNGDHVADVIVTNIGTWNGSTYLNPCVSVLLGNSNGTFQGATTLVAGARPTSLAAADFDGDGRTDLAVVNYQSNTISIFLGSVSGGFQSPTTLAAGSGPYSVAVGHFNGNQRWDLAVANGTSHEVSILLGNGNGTFAGPVNYACGTSSQFPGFVAVADLDLDGKDDLAVANQGSLGSLSVFLGNGDGTFQNQTYPVATVSAPNTIRVADFNVDGRPDLVIGNQGFYYNVTVALNSTPAAVCHVRQGATGANNGATWGAAFAELSQALAFAASQPCVREIWVAGGTYKPASPGGSRSATFQSRSNLAIYGGFAGTESQISQRNIAANPTILSGDLNGDDNGDLNRGDNSYRLMVTDSAATGIRIDGLTFTATYANDTSGPYSGTGALCIDHGSPVVANCTFIGNIGPLGGAITNLYSSALISNCSFLSNKAIAVGGISAGLGGAIWCKGDVSGSGNPMIRGCSFSGNRAAYRGGAVYCGNYGSPKIIQCQFVRNNCDTTGDGGGAVASVTNTNMTVISSVFTGNTAPVGSALLVSDAAAITAENALVVGNSGPGAAIVDGPNSDITLINSTVAYNASATPGWPGGVRGGGAMKTLRNTILWGNTSPGASMEAAQIDIPGGALSMSYCTVMGWSGALGGVGNNGANPQLLRPASPGADGVWGTADDDYGNLRLGPGSGAIDSGDSSAVPPDTYDIDGDGNTTELLPWDLDANPRFIDDPNAANTGVGSPPVDRGCYENNLSTAVWSNPSGGSWTSSANWQGGVIPNANTRAYFDSRVGSTQAQYTATVPSDQTAYSVSALANNITLNLRSGSTTGSISLVAPAADPAPALLVGDIVGLSPSLTITNSAGSNKMFSFVNGIVGNSIGSAGTLAVTSQRANLVSGGILGLGAGGTGTLSVSARGTATLTDLHLGVAPGSQGSIALTGAAPFPSTIAYGQGGSLIVGDAGSGTVTITNQGVLTGTAANRVVLGRQAGSIGLVTLGTPGAPNTAANWTAEGNDFVIGESGTGTLTLNSNATLVTATSNSLILASLPGSSAIVNMAAGSSWTETNQNLNIPAIGGGTATLNIAAGAALDVPGISINPHGRMAGAGTISTSGSVFNAGLIQPEGATPGSAGILTIQGDYEQARPNVQGSVSGELHLKVGGPTPGVNMDQLMIQGDARMGGGVFVSLINNFDPPPNFLPELIHATTRSRNFDVALFPGLTNNRFFKLTYPRDGSVYLGIGSLDGGINFGDPITSATDTPSAMALGDVNNDGLPDLVLAVPAANAHVNPGSVVVLLNGGTVGGVWQGFTGQITILTGVGRNPQGLAVGNFDGVDGAGNGRRALDIAVSNMDDNTLTIIHNSGGGTLGSFTALTPLATGPAPVGVAAGHVLGLAGPLDDIVVANSGVGPEGDTLTLFGNHGGGTHEHDVVPVGPRPRGVVTANLSEHTDGRVDLVSCNTGNGAGNGTVSVRVSSAAPPASWTGPDMAVGIQPVRVLAADFNGDGRPEIVTVDQADGTVSVLVNLGATAFAPRVALPVGTNPSSAAALDMDQDGDPDLAVVASGQVMVLRNDLNSGQIAFAPAAPPPPGSGVPILVDHADVNRDNRDDLVTITTGTRTPGSNIQVNPNGSQGPCYPNCDQSTAPPILNVNDFACFLNAFASGNPYANCDGSTNPPILNVNDFACFLNRFAAGCG